MIAPPAAVIAMVTGALWLGLQEEETGETNVAALDPVPLGDDVVLWWIDPETPVYFVLTPPGNE